MTGGRPIVIGDDYFELQKSDDGKSFTTDKDNKTYTIENSDAVKGHEGHDVRLSGHVDSGANSIHVTSVKMAGEKASKDKSGAMSEQPPK
jgi:hypothetical protein